MVSSVAWLADGASDWPVDTILIVAVVVLNGTLGYLQQTRAERAVEALRAMGGLAATAVRDGVAVRLPARDIVSATCSSSPQATW